MKPGAPAETTHTPIGDLLIVANPVSSSVEKIAPQLEALTNLEGWTSVAHVPTTADEAYGDHLLAQITPGCTVAIAGGDGTVKRTLKLLRDKGYTGEEINILIVGAGKKNDIAHMLHGDDYDNPAKVVTAGEKITIFPGEARMAHPTKPPRIEEFIYSFGLVASAAVAALANKSDFREKQQQQGKVGKWLGERLMALNAILRTPSIQTDRGKAKDITIAAGNRMAGGALNFDTELTNRIETVTSVTRSNLLSILSNIIGRKLGRSLSDRWNGGYETIQIYEDTAAQADGETLDPIPAGTILKIKRAEQGIAVLALNTKT